MAHRPGSVKVYEKSRRIGITWTESADAALNAARRGGTDWWYIGYNKEMALEFVEAAAGWARRFNQAARTIEEIVVVDENNGGLVSVRCKPLTKIPTAKYGTQPLGAPPIAKRWVTAEILELVSAAEASKQK